MHELAWTISLRLTELGAVPSANGSGPCSTPSQDNSPSTPRRPHYRRRLRKGRSENPRPLSRNLARLANRSIQKMVPHRLRPVRIAHLLLSFFGSRELSGPLRCIPVLFVALHVREMALLKGVRSVVRLRHGVLAVHSPRIRRLRVRLRIPPLEMIPVRSRRLLVCRDYCLC